MYRVLKMMLAAVFVVGLLFSVTGGVKAAIGDDPVVTPISGDMEFTTEVVPVASLPGTKILDSQMLAPIGFPAGEAQFEGAGVRILDLDTGKATACFAVSGTQHGWGGKVGVWNGTKWVLLPTTISKGIEDLNSLACASISGNGVYAFIKYIVDTSLLKTSKPACDVVLGEHLNWFILTAYYDPFIFSGPIIEFSTLPWPGENISWRVVRSNYPMTGTTSGSQLIDEFGKFSFSEDLFTFTGPEGSYPVFTLRLETAHCYVEQDFNYEWLAEY